MTDQPKPVAPLGTTDAPVARERPRIYVACLAAYNSGILHGCWIRATTPEDIRDRVSAMLAKSPVPGAEEWAIHDCDGFEDVSLSEAAAFETVCELADFLESFTFLRKHIQR